MAGRVDAPEGIRREPKADEDDEGAVRSERSGPIRNFVCGAYHED